MSYMFTLYKMQIVSTNHNSTNSKWHQYNQIGVALYISGLSTRVIYKRNCLQGSNPYYTLQLVRNFKAQGSIQDNRILKIKIKINKKQERMQRKKLKQCHSPHPTSPSLGHWLAIALFFTSKPQVRDRPKWFEVTNGCHGTIYCSSTLLPVAASTSKNDTLAMELASRMKVPTTTSRLSMPESFYKKPLPQT